MAQEIFERYEKKYLLTCPQYHSLMCEMVKWMSADRYGRHTISNIYFDTENYELIRSSIEKPDYKEKVRLRAYGTVNHTSMVYAELKKKTGGIVYKRRMEMTLEEARNYFYKGLPPKKRNQIFKEIDYAVKRYGLKPMAYVAYDRMAFFGKTDPELRVTFDRRIRCRDSRLDLAQGDSGICLLKSDEILMEIKIPGAMPLWMSRIFSELSIYPISYSKYGTYYKEVLIKRQAEEGGRHCA